MTTKIKVLIFSTTCLLILGGYYLLKGQKNFQSKNSTWPDREYIADLRNSLKNNVQKEGGERAYLKLKEQFEKKEPQSSVIPHLAAHLFGEIIYQDMGMDGLTICDKSFTYGCFHGFFNAITSEKGIEYIPELNRICKENTKVISPLACQHGLGHGLGEYYGPEKVGLSLKECRKMGAESIPFGCVGGVFMEYNFPSMFDFISQNDDVVRKFDENNPYGPCMNVEDEFRKSCYFRLTEWWEVITEKDYRKMGNLCGGIRAEAYKNACFTGIGAALITTNGFLTPQAKESCSLMPNKISVELCLTGSSFILKTVQKNEEAKNICDSDCQSRLIEEKDFLKIN